MATRNISRPCQMSPVGKTLPAWKSLVYAWRELPSCWQIQRTVVFSSYSWCWDSSQGNSSPCLLWAECTRQARGESSGRKYWLMKIRQMSWTQMKMEMWAQALSVFDRRNHFTTVVGMDLVFNDLFSPSSTTSTLKYLYIVPAAGDPKAAIWLEIWLGASASVPNYERG